MRARVGKLLVEALHHAFASCQDDRLDDLSPVFLQDVRGVVFQKRRPHGRLPQERIKNPRHEGYSLNWSICDVQRHEILGNPPIEIIIDVREDRS